MGLAFWFVWTFLSSIRTRTSLVCGEDAVASPSFVSLSGLGRSDECLANALKGDRVASDIVFRVSLHL